MAEIMVTYLDRQCLINEIVKEAKGYGFEVSQESYDWIPVVSDEDVNFTFMKEEVDLDLIAKGIIRERITLQVTVRRMGGNPTVKELYATAKKIEKAAEFMEWFNAMKFTIQEEFHPYRAKGGK